MSQVDSWVKRHSFRQRLTIDAPTADRPDLAV
jgi:hypothetical protein